MLMSDKSTSAHRITQSDTTILCCAALLHSMTDACSQVHTSAQLINPNNDPASADTSGVAAVLADAAPANYTSLQVTTLFMVTHDYN